MGQQAGNPYSRQARRGDRPVAPTHFCDTLLDLAVGLGRDPIRWHTATVGMRLIRPTLTPEVHEPARADLALGLGCVSHARKRFGGHGVERSVTQHDALSGCTK